MVASLRTIALSTLNSNLILLILRIENLQIIRHRPLNSNLILLILKQKEWGTLHGISTLNSNLILLIRILYILNICAHLVFKFQSDSINTLTICLEYEDGKSLNSNLILLIRGSDALMALISPPLNSNLILLIQA